MRLSPWIVPRLGLYNVPADVDVDMGQSGKSGFSVGPSLLCVVAAVVFALLGCADLAADEPEKATADGDVYSLYPSFDDLPGVENQDIRRLWADGIRAEARRDFSTAIRVYVEIARRQPRDSHAYWRTGRAYWQIGEYLPLGDKEERIKYFVLTRDWATAGLNVNPECGECCLYRMIGIARIGTTRGLFTLMRDAKEMAQLLDRGIALKPTHADNEWNTSLGNLYYAASQFYRIAPDWFWLKWIIGVRGDRKLALEYARKAHEIAPMRVDYAVTLGAALLCMGKDEDDEKLLTEGIAVLKRTPRLPTVRPLDDPLFRAHAEQLLAEPSTACEYSPDGWIDVEGTLAKKNGSPQEKDE